MLRGVEQRRHRRRLDDAAGIHHGDPVRRLRDDAKIMGDEDQRRALAAQSRKISRICACVVTSSAVVGSSAMTRSGSQAIAMAIIARWRMPPDI